MKKNISYQVYKGIDVRPNPNQREWAVAELLAAHWSSDVYFVSRAPGAKTPDLRINGQNWEIKSPVGKSRRTIPNILRKAEKQAQNVVVDLSQIKIGQQQAIHRVKFAAQHCSKIKKVVIITKNDQIIEL